METCEGRESGKGNRRRTKEQGAERDNRGLGCTGGAWGYKQTLRFKATELERFARVNTGATGDQAPRSLEGMGAEVLTITLDIMSRTNFPTRWFGSYACDMLIVSRLLMSRANFPTRWFRSYACDMLILLTYTKDL